MMSGEEVMHAYQYNLDQAVPGFSERFVRPFQARPARGRGGPSSDPRHGAHFAEKFAALVNLGVAEEADNAARTVQAAAFGQGLVGINDHHPRVVIESGFFQRSQ